MKFTMTAISLGLLMVSAAASAGTVSNITTATTNVEFSSTSTVTNTLIPVTGLKAGAISSSTLLAKGTVSTNDTGPVAFGVTASDRHVESGSAFIATGGNNSNNTLSFKILPGNLLSVKVEEINGRTWTINDTSTGSLDYNVFVAGAQNINADTYNISVDAAVYQP